MYELTSIEESAVFAAPHKDFGEAVVAAVVRKNVAIFEAEIINYLSDKSKGTSLSTLFRIRFHACITNNAPFLLQANSFPQ